MKKILSFAIISFLFLGTYAQLDRSVQPKAGPAPKINIGKPKSFELKNGLKVYVVENHKTPKVSYSLSLDYAPIVENDAVGYVSVAGGLMRSGTTTKTKAQLDEEIDFMGATLRTSSHGMYASSLTKNSDELLSIMSDILMNPVFPQAELDKTKKQLLTGLQANMEDPGAIAGNIASKLVYGEKHPYGEIQHKEDIENITVEKCKSFYNTYYRPNIAYLVIVGDINLKTAKKQAKKYFGKWKAAEVKDVKPAMPAKFDGRRVVFAHKEGATQSYIDVTYAVDLKPGSGDAIAARVMNGILGGGSFSARLFRNLREDKAYTYGAYSSLDSDPYVGSFSASSNVRGEVTDSALVEVLYEMDRLRTELVDKKDLELTKAGMAGSFARALESPQTIARFALNIKRYNLPEDYYATYLEKLAAVTPEDVQRVAKKYLKPDNALILAVGNKEVIAKTMKRLSKSGKVEQYDYFGNFVEPAKAVMPKGLTAEKVIDNYIAAIGGREKLEAVKDLQQKMNMNMQGMTLEIISKQKDGKLLSQTKMNGNVMQEQRFDGVKGYVRSPMGEQVLEGPMAADMKSQATLFPELNLAASGDKLELKGIEEVNGENCFKIVRTSANGMQISEFFNMETGLRQKIVAQTPQGVMSTIVGKYIDVDGIKFPEMITIQAGPQKMEMKTVEVLINKGIDNAEFEIK